MKLSEIILPWYKLASGEHVDQTNVFFKFIALWIAFNGIYGAWFEEKNSDRPKVMRFASDSDVFKRHKNLLVTDKNYLQAIKCLAAEGVMDLYDPEKYIYKIEKTISLRHVMQCVYQVRNNLFHAGKPPGNPRDESLVQSAYIIVSRLIEPWLKPEIIDSWDKTSSSAYEGFS